MFYLRSLLTALPLLSAIPATAQTAPEHVSGFVGLGPAFTPEYTGSDTMKLNPFALADINYGEYFLQLRGLNLRANVISSSHFIAGPSIGYSSSRDDDVDSKAVSRLDKIDAAVEAGGFVGLRFGGGQRGEGQVELTLSVSGSKNGFVGTAGASYALFSRESFSLSFDTEINYANGEYNRTYFGITQPEAARSGLRNYRPGAGLRDVGIGLTAGYQINEDWGLVGRVSYNYLVGDAADSPIVTQEGSKGQVVGGIAATYRF
jgi:outer membrane scaffolding protein for murein synthesis (MipA/OmpV family)